VSSWDTNN